MLQRCIDEIKVHVCLSESWEISLAMLNVTINGRWPNGKQ